MRIIRLGQFSDSALESKDSNLKYFGAGNQDIMARYAGPTLGTAALTLSSLFCFSKSRSEGSFGSVCAAPVGLGFNPLITGARTERVSRSKLPHAGLKPCTIQDIQDLLPLNRARRLRGNVIHHSIHSTHLIHNPIGNCLQDFVGQRNPVGGHAVFGLHGADGAGVGVGALVSHNTYRHHGQEDGEGLPDFLIETSLFDFADNNLIAIPEQAGTLFGNFAENADGQSWAREQLTLENIFGHSEVAADPSYLIFEQVLQRLDKLQFYLLRECAYVLIRLDEFRRAAHGARFDHVGIERPLDQPLHFTSCFVSTRILQDALGFVVEDFDEFVADNFALRLGVGHSRQLLHEAIGGIDRN